MFAEPALKGGSSLIFPSGALLFGLHMDRPISSHLRLFSSAAGARKVLRLSQSLYGVKCRYYVLMLDGSKTNIHIVSRYSEPSRGSLSIVLSGNGEYCSAHFHRTAVSRTDHSASLGCVGEGVVPISLSHCPRYGRGTCTTGYVYKATSRAVLLKRRYYLSVRLARCVSDGARNTFWELITNVMPEI